MSTAQSSLLSRRLLALVAVIVATGVIYTAVSASHMRSAKANVAELDNLPVAVATPRDIEQVIQVPAVFKPYQEADLDAKVHGYVKKLNVDVGDVVKKNQVLAILDAPELKDQKLRAEAAVAVARNQAQKASVQYEDEKIIYDRLAGVMRDNAELIAQQDVDQAKARADGAHAALIAAQAAISEAEANLTQLRDTEAYTQIIAPFDGVVTQRMVDEGALVGGGGSAASAIFHVAQVDKLRLVANVPETAVPMLAVGREAKVEVTDLSRTLNLKVSRMADQLADQTRTMHIECDVDNADRKVTAGMYAQLLLPLVTHKQVLTVPVQAVHDQNATGGATVYALGANGVAVAKHIKLGLADPEFVEVAEGLGKGESVAVGVIPQVDGSVKYAAVKTD